MERNYVTVILCAIDFSRERVHSEVIRTYDRSMQTAVKCSSRCWRLNIQATMDERGLSV